MSTLGPLHHTGRGPEIWPYQLILVLSVVETMPQPDAPDDVVVGTNSRHEVPTSCQPEVSFVHMCDRDLPPPVTFEDKAPRHTHLPSPSDKPSTMLIV